MAANPVQLVIAADAAAQEEIARARRELEESGAQARAQARALTARAEARIRAALSRYEAEKKGARELEAGKLEAEALECRAAAQAAVRGAWDRTINEVVGEFWPARGEG